MNRSISKEQTYREIERIFRTLLPQNGLAVREEQIALCYTMIGHPVSKQYRPLRCRRRDRQNLCLSDRLHFAEKIRAPCACRFPVRGGLHLQRRLAGRYHWRIHSIFIPDFSGEPHHLQAHPGNGAKR